MKKNSLSKLLRGAALILGLVFGVFFAGQARANYIDGANLYGGYFAERAGMDPSGETSSSPVCGTCKCISIDVEILDANFTIYDYPVYSASRGGTINYKRLGARIKTSFSIEGDVKSCKYYQDESGGTTAIAWKYTASDKKPENGWTVINGANRQILPIGGIAIFNPGGVVYTDRMGATYFPNNTTDKHLHVRVKLAPTSRCVSSDGTKIEKKWTWSNAEAYAWTRDGVNKTVVVAPEGQGVSQ